MDVVESPANHSLRSSPNANDSLRADEDSTTPVTTPSNRRRVSKKLQTNLVTTNSDDEDDRALDAALAAAAAAAQSQSLTKSPKISTMALARSAMEEKKRAMQAEKVSPTAHVSAEVCIDSHPMEAAQPKDDGKSTETVTQSENVDEHWLQFLDEETGLPFEFNPHTFISRWVVLPEVWEMYYDDDGNAYYYNRETGVSQWEDPYATEYANQVENDMEVVTVDGESSPLPRTSSMLSLNSPDGTRALRTVRSARSLGLTTEVASVKSVQFSEELCSFAPAVESVEDEESDTPLAILNTRSPGQNKQSSPDTRSPLERLPVTPASIPGTTRSDVGELASRTLSSSALRATLSFRVSKSPTVDDSLKPKSPAKTPLPLSSSSPSGSDPVKANSLEKPKASAQVPARNGFDALKEIATEERRVTDPKDGIVWIQYRAMKTGPAFYAREGQCGGQWAVPQIFNTKAPSEEQVSQLVSPIPPKSPAPNFVQSTIGVSPITPGGDTINRLTTSSDHFCSPSETSSLEASGDVVDYFALPSDEALAILSTEQIDASRNASALNIPSSLTGIAKSPPVSSTDINPTRLGSEAKLSPRILESGVASLPLFQPNELKLTPRVLESSDNITSVPLVAETKSSPHHAQVPALEKKSPRLEEVQSSTTTVLKPSNELTDPKCLDVLDNNPTPILPTTKSPTPHDIRSAVEVLASVKDPIVSPRNTPQIPLSAEALSLLVQTSRPVHLTDAWICLYSAAADILFYRRKTDGFCQMSQPEDYTSSPIKVAEIATNSSDIVPPLGAFSPQKSELEDQTHEDIFLTDFLRQETPRESQNNEDHDDLLTTLEYVEQVTAEELHQFLRLAPRIAEEEAQIFISRLQSLPAGRRIANLGDSGTPSTTIGGNSTGMGGMDREDARHAQSRGRLHMERLHSIFDQLEPSPVEPLITFRQILRLSLSQRQVLQAPTCSVFDRVVSTSTLSQFFADDIQVPELYRQASIPVAECRPGLGNTSGNIGMNIGAQSLKWNQSIYVNGASWGSEIVDEILPQKKLFVDAQLERLPHGAWEIFRLHPLVLRNQVKLPTILKGSSVTWYRHRHTGLVQRGQPFEIQMSMLVTNSSSDNSRSDAVSIPLGGGLYLPSNWRVEKWTEFVLELPVPQAVLEAQGVLLLRDGRGGFLFYCPRRKQFSANGRFDGVLSSESNDSTAKNTLISTEQVASSDGFQQSIAEISFRTSQDNIWRRLTPSVPQKTLSKTVDGWLRETKTARQQASQGCIKFTPSINAHLQTLSMVTLNKDMEIAHMERTPIVSQINSNDLASHTENVLSVALSQAENSLSSYHTPRRFLLDAMLSKDKDSNNPNFTGRTTGEIWSELLSFELAMDRPTYTRYLAILSRLSDDARSPVSSLQLTELLVLQGATNAAYAAFRYSQDLLRRLHDTFGSFGSDVALMTLCDWRLAILSGQPFPSAADMLSLTELASTSDSTYVLASVGDFFSRHQYSDWAETIFLSALLRDCRQEIVCLKYARHLVRRGDFSTALRYYSRVIGTEGTSSGSVWQRVAKLESTWLSELGNFVSGDALLSQQRSLCKIQCQNPNTPGAMAAAVASGDRNQAAAYVATASQSLFQLQPFGVAYKCVNKALEADEDNGLAHLILATLGCLVLTLSPIDEVSYSLSSTNSTPPIRRKSHGGSTAEGGVQDSRIVSSKSSSLLRTISPKGHLLRSASSPFTIDNSSGFSVGPSATPVSSEGIQISSQDVDSHFRSSLGLLSPGEFRVFALLAYGDYLLCQSGEVRRAIQVYEEALSFDNSSSLWAATALWWLRLEVTQEFKAAGNVLLRLLRQRHPHCRSCISSLASFTQFYQASRNVTPTEDETLQQLLKTDFADDKMNFQSDNEVVETNEDLEDDNIPSSTAFSATRLSAEFLEPTQSSSTPLGSTNQTISLSTTDPNVLRDVHECIALYVMVAHQLWRTGHLDSARRYALSSLRLAPKYTPALRILGMLSFFTGDRRLAGRYFLASVEKVRTPGAADLNCAGAYRLSRHGATQAISLLKRSISITPTSSTVHRLIGLIYVHYHGDLKKALVYFNRAVCLGGSDDLESNRLHAQVLLDEGQFHEAKSHFLHSLAICPYDPISLACTAICMMKIHQTTYAPNSSVTSAYMASTSSLEPLPMYEKNPLGDFFSWFDEWRSREVVPHASPGSSATRYDLRDISPKKLAAIISGGDAYRMLETARIILHIQLVRQEQRLRVMGVPDLLTVLDDKQIPSIISQTISRYHESPNSQNGVNTVPPTPLDIWEACMAYQQLRQQFVFLHYLYGRFEGEIGTEDSLRRSLQHYEYVIQNGTGLKTPYPSLAKYACGEIHERLDQLDHATVSYESALESAELSPMALLRIIDSGQETIRRLSDTLNRYHSSSSALCTSNRFNGKPLVRKKSVVDKGGTSTSKKGKKKRSKSRKIHDAIIESQGSLQNEFLVPRRVASSTPITLSQNMAHNSGVMGFGDGVLEMFNTGMASQGGGNVNTLANELAANADLFHVNSDDSDSDEQFNGNPTLNSTSEPIVRRVLLHQRLMETALLRKITLQKSLRGLSPISKLPFFSTVGFYGDFSAQFLLSFGRCEDWARLYTALPGSVSATQSTDCYHF